MNITAWSELKQWDIKKAWEIHKSIFPKEHYCISEFYKKAQRNNYNFKKIIYEKSPKYDTLKNIYDKYPEPKCSYTLFTMRIKKWYNYDEAIKVSNHWEKIKKVRKLYNPDKCKVSFKGFYMRIFKWWNIEDSHNLRSYEKRNKRKH